MAFERSHDVVYGFLYSFMRETGSLLFFDGSNLFAIVFVVGHPLTFSAKIF